MKVRKASKGKVYNFGPTDEEDPVSISEERSESVKRMVVTFLSLTLTILLFLFILYNFYGIYLLINDYESIDRSEYEITDSSYICSSSSSSTEDATKFNSAGDVLKIVQDAPDTYYLIYLLYFWAGATILTFIFKLVIKSGSCCACDRRWTSRQIQFYENWPSAAESKFLLLHMILTLIVLFPAVPIVYVEYDECLKSHISTWFLENYTYITYSIPALLLLLIILLISLCVGKSEYDTEKSDANKPSGCLKRIFSSVISFVIFGTAMAGSLVFIALQFSWVVSFGYGNSVGIVFTLLACLVDCFLSPCAMMCCVKKTELIRGE